MTDDELTARKASFLERLLDTPTDVIRDAIEVGAVAIPWDPPKVRDLTERTVPWARYRGRVRLIQAAALSGVVTLDLNNPAGASVTVPIDVLADVRRRWEGREIDTIPSDDELAAWFAWVALMPWVIVLAAGAWLVVKLAGWRRTKGGRRV